MIGDFYFRSSILLMSDGFNFPGRRRSSPRIVIKLRRLLKRLMFLNLESSDWQDLYSLIIFDLSRWRVVKNMRRKAFYLFFKNSRLCLPVVCAQKKSMTWICFHFSCWESNDCCIKIHNWLIIIITIRLSCFCTI